MATAQEYLTAIRRRYPTIKVEGTNLMNELERRAKEGATVDQVLQSASGFSEIEQGRREMLDAATVKPLSNDDLTGFRDQAQGLIKPVTDARRQAIDQDFEDLETRLRRNASEAEGALTTKFDELGLLRSGRTAAGLGRIQEDLSANLSRGNIQRALQQAEAVLQESGFTQDFSSKLAEQELGRRQQNAQAGLANIGLFGREIDNELQRRGFDLTATKSIADIYTQFLNSGEMIPPELYDQIRSQLGGV